jgi:hypothetical protein
MLLYIIVILDSFIAKWSFPLRLWNILAMLWKYENNVLAKIVLMLLHHLIILETFVDL